MWKWMTEWGGEAIADDWSVKLKGVNLMSRLDFLVYVTTAHFSNIRLIIHQLLNVLLLFTSVISETYRLNKNF